MFFHQYVDSIIEGRPDPLRIKDQSLGAFRPSDMIDWCAFALLMHSQMRMPMNQIFNTQRGGMHGVDCGFMGAATMQMRYPPPQVAPNGMAFQPPPVQSLERPIHVAY